MMACDAKFDSFLFFFRRSSHLFLSIEINFDNSFIRISKTNSLNWNGFKFFEIHQSLIHKSFRDSHSSSRLMFHVYWNRLVVNLILVVMKTFFARPVPLITNFFFSLSFSLSLSFFFYFAIVPLMVTLTFVSEQFIKWNLSEKH